MRDSPFLRPASFVLLRAMTPISERRWHEKKVEEQKEGKKRGRTGKERKGKGKKEEKREEEKKKKMNGVSQEK